MTDYNAMYHRLFGAVTDAGRRLAEASALLHRISQELMVAQQDCEEIYLSTAEEAPEQ